MIKKLQEDGWEVQLIVDEANVKPNGTMPFGLSIKPLPDGKMYGNTGEISVEMAMQILNDKDYLKTMLDYLKTSYPESLLVKK